MSKPLEFTTLTVESADNGWIVRQSGKPTKMFIRWESLVVYLRDQLSSTLGG